jgi:DNA-directed RNA polymerase specialized sigma24 family protein
VSRPLTEQDLVETYRATVGPLYAYVSRRVGGDTGLAEDPAGHLMRAIGDWPRKGMPSEPLAWLIRVARNTLISYFRRMRPQLVEPAQLDLIEVEPSMAADDRARRLSSTGAGAASSAHADLLEEFYFAGKSVRDIARERSLSERAVGAAPPGPGKVEEENGKSIAASRHAASRR